MTADWPQGGFVSVQADVQTLSVRLGVRRVFWACIMLLELAYAGAIGLGALSQVILHTCCRLAHLRSLIKQNPHNHVAPHAPEAAAL